MLFRERLHVPVLWWVLAVGIALSLLAAVGLYLGPVWGVAVFVGAVAVAAALFVSAAVVIEVDEAELRVGRAVIERSWIQTCLALDARAAELRAGVQADARAHLVLRPYVATAVEIVLRDPDDPVPYWLVSTRHPTRLATVLAARTEAAQ
jgi:hypothetical protein